MQANVSPLAPCQTIKGDRNPQFLFYIKLLAVYLKIMMSHAVKPSHQEYVYTVAQLGT